MPLLECGHEHAETGKRICRHLLENRESSYVGRFTGSGIHFDLICTNCRNNLDGIETNLVAVCPTCFEGVREDGDWEGFAGEPEVKERESGLRFHHHTLALQVSLRDRILDVQPASTLDKNIWIAFTQASEFLRLNLEDGSTTILCRPAVTPVNTAEEVMLRVSPDEKLAVLANRRGQHGIVVELETGKTTMSLDRGNYHHQHCNFPAAFIEMDGRLRLVHGTKWNRLDVSDPHTGRRFTDRPDPVFGEDRKRPEHYLDYFHCGLTVSPNQEYIADNGWVWHPVGVVTTWSLRRWLHENVWESEDGPTRKAVCWRDYFWDGPLCWIGDDRLAVWGLGEDEEWLLPAVRIFDAVTGNEERWFPGPKGSLEYDRYLFSFQVDEGTSVWDVTSGERLLREPSFCPLRYHRGIKAFLTVLPDGRFRISRLRGSRIDPAWLRRQGGTVEKLARAFEQERDFARLGVLADALEEVGCQDAELLAHCRRGEPHGDRCWVVDLLLGEA